MLAITVTVISATAISTGKSSTSNVETTENADESSAVTTTVTTTLAASSKVTTSSEVTKRNESSTTRAHTKIEVSDNSNSEDVSTTTEVATSTEDVFETPVVQTYNASDSINNSWVEYMKYTPPAVTTVNW